MYGDSPCTLNSPLFTELQFCVVGNGLIDHVNPLSVDFAKLFELKANDATVFELNEVVDGVRVGVDVNVAVGVFVDVLVGVVVNVGVFVGVTLILGVMVTV